MACGVWLEWMAPTMVVAQPAAAEALFRAGREAVERGDHRTACERFRESYRLETAVGTLINIGMCEEQLGELSRAWAHFQEAFHVLPPEDRRRETIEERLSALDARLPRITIGLAPSAPAETRVAIGELELTNASFGVALPYDPGQYTIVVSAPGYEGRSYPLMLSEGARAQLTVEPGPALPAPSVEPAIVASPAASPPSVSRTIDVASPAAPVPPDTLQRDVGWLLVGVASASGIASIIAGAFVLDRAAIVERECPDSSCNLAGERAAASGRAAYATFVAAGLTAIVTSSLGVYLLLDAAPASSGASLAVSGRF